MVFQEITCDERPMFRVPTSVGFFAEQEKARLKYSKPGPAIPVYFFKKHIALLTERGHSYLLGSINIWLLPEPGTSAWTGHLSQFVRLAPKLVEPLQALTGLFSARILLSL